MCRYKSFQEQSGTKKGVRRRSGNRVGIIPKDQAGLGDCWEPSTSARSIGSGGRNHNTVGAIVVGRDRASGSILEIDAADVVEDFGGDLLGFTGGPGIVFS